MNVSTPARAPTFAGVKVMLTLHEAEAARMEPQVLAETAKSAESVPAMLMLLKEMGTVPALVNVTDWDAVVVPTAVPAKVRLEGVTVALDVAPVPENATV